MDHLILHDSHHYRLRLPDGTETHARYNADADAFLTDALAVIPCADVAFVGITFARRLHPIAQARRDQRRGVRP